MITKGLQYLYASQHFVIQTEISAKCSGILRLEKILKRFRNALTFMVQSVLRESRVFPSAEKHRPVTSSPPSCALSKKISGREPHPALIFHTCLVQRGISILKCQRMDTKDSLEYIGPCPEPSLPDQQETGKYWRQCFKQVFYLVQKETNVWWSDLSVLSSALDKRNDNANGKAKY